MEINSDNNDRQSSDSFQRSQQSEFQQPQQGQQKIDNPEFQQYVSRQQNNEDIEKKQKQGDRQFQITQNYPIQKLFIMYTSYKKQMEAFCKNYQCNLLFGLNLIKIKGPQRDIVQECSDNLREMINKIKYCELKKIRDKTQQFKSYKILFSPYYNSQFKKQKIKLTGFNQNIYAFSETLLQEELQKIQSRIVKQKYIFSVQFKNRNSTHSLDVYKEIILFLKKSFLYYEEKFKEYKVVVQINYRENCVYTISNDQKSCIYGKTNVKNILQGMICYTFKGSQLSQEQFKDLTKYLQKLSKYPIHLGRLSKKQYLVITKDTIMKQFVNKDRFLQMIKMSVDTDIGIFLLGAFHRNQKKEIISKVCKDSGFHTNLHKYFLYFTNTFVQDLTNEHDRIKANAIILLNIAQGLNDNKQKYQLISKRVQNKVKQLSYNASRDKNYFYTSGKQYHQKLSKRLNRDVMAQGIQMKKNFNVEYNLCQQKQIDDVCWYQDQKTKQIIQIKLQNTKKGNFFYGKKKNRENGQQVLYKIQYQIFIL